MSNLIYLKLEPEELVDSKKRILSTQANLIVSSQYLKKYKLLRMRELNLKKRFLKKLKESKIEIKKLEQILPKLEIPKIIHKKVEKEGMKEIPLKKDNLEIQLEEIQKKLKELEK